MGIHDKFSKLVFQALPYEKSLIHATKDFGTENYNIFQEFGVIFLFFNKSQSLNFFNISNGKI